MNGKNKSEVFFSGKRQNKMPFFQNPEKLCRSHLHHRTCITKCTHVQVCNKLGSGCIRVHRMLYSNEPHRFIKPHPFLQDIGILLSVCVSVMHCTITVLRVAMQ